jgi:hypothetical protein
VQRGLRTLVASSDSFTTSISQQHFGFTHRYLSFLFIAMIASFEQIKSRWKDAALRRHIFQRRGYVAPLQLRNPRFGIVIFGICCSYSRESRPSYI